RGYQAPRPVTPGSGLLPFKCLTEIGLPPMREELVVLGQCPHCGVRNAQVRVCWTGGVPRTTPPRTWQGTQCLNEECQRLILIESMGKQIVATFPARRYELGARVPVSAEVRSEYREAGACLEAEAFLASMTMSRRVLQRCLKEQGCTDRNLVDQIADA